MLSDREDMLHTLMMSLTVPSLLFSVYIFIAHTVLCQGNTVCNACVSEWICVVCWKSPNWSVSVRRELGNDRFCEVLPDQA